MIGTLERLNSTERRSLLAAAALATEPKPGIASENASVGRYADDIDHLIKEVREKLSIAVNDPNAKFQVDSFLSALLTTEFERDADKAKTLNRASNSGKLAPHFYQPEIPKPTLQTFTDLSVQQSHIFDAVKNPDDYQHLTTELDFEKERVSLFVKKVVSRDFERRHWLLVQTHRVDLRQIVQAAWRVFPADVNSAEVSTPLELLRSFVEAFGETIDVQGKTTKFLDAIDIPFGEEFKASWSPGVNYFITMNRSDNSMTGLSRLNFGYCLNLDRYAKALRTHGFRVVDREYNRQAPSQFVWKSL